MLRALWLLRDEHPELRWVIVGDGPERPALERLAAELELTGRVDFRGALAPEAALDAARAGGVFVLPSVEEAFGVAYIEAMAGGVPAIGVARRARPGGDRGVRRRHAARPAGRPEALAAELRAVLDEPAWRRELGAAARANVEANFTWEGCGRATVAAYEDALR